MRAIIVYLHDLCAKSTRLRTDGPNLFAQTITWKKEMRNAKTKFLAIAILLSVALVFSTSVFASYVDLIVTGAGASTMLEIDDSEVKCDASLLGPGVIYLDPRVENTGR